jgi:hypothetical protein
VAVSTSVALDVALMPLNRLASRQLGGRRLQGAERALQRAVGRQLGGVADLLLLQHDQRLAFRRGEAGEQARQVEVRPDTQT